MLNWPLYRVSLLPALLAAVVLLFSVLTRPEPLRSAAPPDPFDTARALALTRELLREAPGREPGSRGDLAAAGFVERAFRAVPGGEVSVGEFGPGESRRNVSLTIPGESSEVIVIAAPRDCGAGTCAVSSGAATGALLELAETLPTTSHPDTIRLVSLDGSVSGASGARELGDSLSGQEPPRAVVVLAAPASAERAGPYVIPFSSGPQSTSAQLTETAAEAARQELGGSGQGGEGTLSALMRLAVPANFGQQAPLIADGLDAVTLTTAGELPLPESRDGPSSVSVSSLGAAGRATLALLGDLEAGAGPLEHGPGAYLPLSGKLIPGWAISLLALALLLPVVVVTTEAVIRLWRRREPLPGALAFTLSRSLPFLVVALLALLMALVGILPAPAFPYDPARHPFGPGPAVALLFLTAAFAGCVWVLRRVPLAPAAAEAVGVAVDALVAVCLAGVWLLNPFLALLLAPTAHLWLLAGSPELRPRRLLTGLLIAAGLAVPLLIAVSLASRLGVGLELPWQVLLLLTGGWLGAPAVLGFCLLGGCLLTLISASAAPVAPAPQPRRRPRVRGPATYAGPGSLGGTESALPRR
ncbi:MAG: hypothetical protein U0R52_13135 [Solirubrobacterales bacterium]